MHAKKTLVRAAAAAVAMLVLVGCNGSFAGKGSLVSQGGTGSASLVFRVLCDAGTNTVTGVVKYSDRAAGVQLNGKANGNGSAYGVPYECDGDRTAGHYVGSYTSSYGTPGAFVIDLLASSSECGGKGLVTIAATSGVHAGYTNTSCFKGTIRPLDRVSVPVLSDLT